MSKKSRKNEGMRSMVVNSRGETMAVYPNGVMPLPDAQIEFVDGDRTSGILMSGDTLIGAVHIEAAYGEVRCEGPGEPCDREAR